MAFVRAALCRGLPAVTVGNAKISLTVLTGGGHVAAISTPDCDINPLWSPPWNTTTPAHRRLHAATDPNFQPDNDPLEAELLSSIAGHSLCCDVFGAHSENETAKGACFHGEAGQVTWDVLSAAPGELTLRALLPEAQLSVERTFTAAPDGGAVVRVDETLSNRTGIDRALGVSQHVTLDESFLDVPGGASFAANAGRGMTWPEDVGDSGRWAVGEEFTYPEIPLKDNHVAVDGAQSPVDDWRRFPRCESNGDLLTMRVGEDDPDNLGWFVAQRPTENDGECLALAYAWDVSTFPWLMTWEENRARAGVPWSGRTLCRGLEFGSYALAMGRRWNVEKATLFDAPTFEWLDAHEQRSTSYHITLQTVGSAEALPLAMAAHPGGRLLCSSEEGGVVMPLH